MKSENFILGRGLSAEEVKQLQDGTKVFVNETNEESHIYLKQGDRLNQDGTRDFYYITDMQDNYPKSIKSVQEVCFLNDVEQIVFEQIKNLKDDARVFVVDSLIGNQWTVKNGSHLVCSDKTHYDEIIGKGSTYAGRKVELYVPVSEKKESTYSKFKIGDRVISLSENWATGKKGIVIAFDENLVGVEFENKVDGGHCCRGKGKNHHCFWIQEEFLKIAPLEENTITIFYEGEKTTVKLGDIIEKGVCDYSRGIELGIVLEKLGKKLQKPDLKIMDAQDFKDFLNGNVRVICVEDSDMVSFAMLLGMVQLKLADKDKAADGYKGVVFECINGHGVFENNNSNLTGVRDVRFSSKAVEKFMEENK